MNTSRAHRGFTLIELMITVVMIGILVAVAAPSFDSAINGSRLAGAANELTGAMNTARSLAVSRSARVALCGSSDGSTCAGGTGDWEGWIAFVDTDNNCTRASGEELLKTGTIDAPVVVKPSNNISSQNNCITFEPVGRARPVGGAVVFSATLAACLPTTKPADNVRAISITGGRTVLRKLNGSGACATPADT